MKKLNLLLLCALTSLVVRSQPDSVDNTWDDTIAFRPGAIHLQPVPIFAYNFMTSKEISEFRTMLYRINKVYPYAIEALAIMKEADAELVAREKKRHQKKYRKETEKELREEYKDQLKQLTTRESEVLIKIVERATGENLYDIIKKYKDGITASWWQSVAKLAGLDLKEGYDPERWRYMEIILKAKEAGAYIPMK